MHQFLHGFSVPSVSSCSIPPGLCQRGIVQEMLGFACLIEQELTEITEL